MSSSKPKFVLQRMSDTSDESLLDELKRVALAIGPGSMTKANFDEVSRVSSSTVQRRFGSWEDALRLAGLADRYTRSGYSAPVGVGRRQSTDAEILEELRDLAKALGKDWLNSEEIRSNLSLATSTLISRFGSTGNALTRAGLKQSRVGRRYSDEERFENLLLVWTHLGRAPKYQEMNRPPSSVGAKAYVTRYGGWLKALEAFVASAEGDSDSIKDTTSADEKVTERNQHVVSAPASQPEDQRNIRLGQRFRILKRDSFKCVLCGNSPAVDPTCKLHVDHITPFSRGGKTIDVNLRALCADCNIGRGDRFDD